MRAKHIDSNWGITRREASALEPLLSGAVLRVAPQLAGALEQAMRGGKRLRPALTIAAAGQRDQVAFDADVLAAAAAVELLHCATLVHDDVIDEASSRHGRPTINAHAGLGTALLTGDLLIGASIGLAAQVSAPAAALVAGTLVELCAGQAHEAEHRYDPDLDEAAAVAIARAKTGTLLATAARLGGLIAGYPTPVVDALDRFGAAFGTSLQLVDDALDLASTPELLGKPAPADFAAGTMTLPAVVALAESSELRALVRSGLRPDEQQRAAELVRAGGGVEYTVRQAAREADSAQADLLDAAGAYPQLVELARWPRRYLRAQLSAKTDPRLRRLTAVDEPALIRA